MPRRTMLYEETKASRKAIEMVELPGGVVEDSERPSALPAAFVTRGFFSPIKKEMTVSRHTRNRPAKPSPPLPQGVATQAEMKGLTPLAYMLAVMRNPKSSQRRRDRMAVVCARYLHARPADSSVDKKRQLLEAAREAGGDEWADDLDGDWRQ